MMTYPAKITWSETDRVFEVEFPDCPGCITYGETTQEAIDMAQDALSGWLAVHYAAGRNVPEPSSSPEKGMYLIDVEPHVAIPITIRRLREAAGLSQTDVAKRLGIKHQTYQRWEHVDANITIRNLERVAKALGGVIRVEIKSA